MKAHKLGRHTLVCGDCLEHSPPESLSAVVFDPPFDSELMLGYPMPDCDNVLAFTDPQWAYSTVKKFGAPNWVFTWDTVSPWFASPYRPLRQAKHCFWYGRLADYRNEMPGRRLGDIYAQQLSAMGKSDPFWQPHSKPIAWVASLIANLVRGDTVYDPVAGSGTTLIACEIAGKTAVCVEIDQQACDRIVERWEAFNSGVKRQTQGALFGEPT